MYLLSQTYVGTWEHTLCMKLLVVKGKYARTDQNRAKSKQQIDEILIVSYPMVFERSLNRSKTVTSKPKPDVPVYLYLNC